MKRTKTIQILGALAIAAALVMTTASCSSEDNLVTNPDQPVQEQGMTITVSANIADDASTRSMVEESKDDNGIKRTLKFTEGDQLYVYNRYDIYPVKGMLTMVENSLSADGKSASFTGSLQRKIDNSWKDYTNYGDEDPLEGTEATLVHKDMVYETDYFFDNNNVINFKRVSVSDIETLMTRNLHVTGDYNSSTKSFALSSDDVIFNCVFTGLAASTEYYCQLRYPFSPGYIVTGGHSFTTDANGMSSHAFAVPYPGDDAHPWEIEIELNSTSTTIGTISLGELTLEKKIYNVSRHWNGSAFSKTVDLSTVSHDLVVGSGMTLTGELGSNVKISIAPGATVTLNRVTINGVNNDAYRWAGLTCLGNAHIVLAEDNTVSGFYRDFPGIQPGPAGTTLTISSIWDSDNLTIRNNDHAAGIGCMAEGTCGNITIIGGKVEVIGGCEAAGIGSSYMGTCGNITISGGSVTATGGDYAAGIGSGSEGTCGNITIIGGKVEVEGGWEAAGIGSSYKGTCGNITINNKNGLTSVTATRGEEASPIGNGTHGANCGDVKIFGKESIPSDGEDLGDGFYFHITNNGAEWTIDKPEQ